nr:hypothetical protein [uncultured Desulfobulbus sp.]
MALPQKVEISQKLLFVLMSFKRGSVHHQVHHALETLTQLGQSRHQAKREARALNAKTPQQIAKHTGIYSIRTRRAYQNSCAAFLKYCRDAKNFASEAELRPTKNALEITPEHVKKYLSELAERVPKSTVMGTCAALSKFATGLSNLDQIDRNWDGVFKASKQGLKTHKPEPRAYINPLGLIDELHGVSKILAELQLYNGLRIHEMSKLTAENLGYNFLHLTNTKGGRFRTTIPVPKETFASIKSIIELTGSFEPDLRRYAHELRIAAEKSGQPATGSHGLRHNYAQSRMYALVDGGFTYEEARKTVAQELGHSRPGIVETYLRR